MVMNTMTRVAICYWGLTRSTKKIFNSHHTHLFNVLKEHTIDYDVFMHTWRTENSFIWEEKQDKIDYEEYKLLEPNYYQIDSQDDFLASIKFSDYFNAELYQRYGDSIHEWKPMLIRNHLCALESQNRVTNMVLENERKYDYVIYIRPDVFIATTFQVQYLYNTMENQISIPDNEHYSGYNDRFAIVRYEHCFYYGKRITEIIEFRKTHGRIVSEKYVKYILDKYFQSIHFIDFKFEIVRP